ncbi:MAG: hypothetical protein MZV70_64260 [Desulfobacterales bacterium]|nr:hypothetical protein [Desulfobacterales bacterium]
MKTECLRARRRRGEQGLAVHEERLDRAYRGRAAWGSWNAGPGRRGSERQKARTGRWSRLRWLGACWRRADRSNGLGAGQIRQRLNGADGYKLGEVADHHRGGASSCCPRLSGLPSGPGSAAAQLMAYYDLVSRPRVGAADRARLRPAGPPRWCSSGCRSGRSCLPPSRAR